MVTVREQPSLTAIYLMVDKDGYPLYVGKSLYPDKRCNFHLKTKVNSVAYFILQWVPSVSFKQFEKAWIKYFKQLGFSLENRNEGGAGATFFTFQQRNHISIALAKPEVYQKLTGPNENKKASWTPERRLAKSNEYKGRKPWNAGKTKKTNASLAKMADVKRDLAQTPEYQKIFSKAGKGNTGKKKSPEHAAKMRAMRVGAKRSAETISRLSASHTGKTQSPETVAKRIASRKRTMELKRANADAAIIIE